MEKTAIQLISLETHTHIVNVSLFLNEDGVVFVSIVKNIGPNIVRTKYSGLCVLGIIPGSVYELIIAKHGRRWLRTLA